MPQLEKGGKYVFGWSQIGENGNIVIPAEAVKEYGLKPGTEVILISGSKSSGGFVMAIKSLLKQSQMSSILTKKPELDSEQSAEGEIVRIGDRKYCRSKVGDNNTIVLNAQILEAFGIGAGDRLLSVRGSYIGVSMISKGLIVECAKRHSELVCY
jgi:bifunctional DNA-binding transcriptional regulator/antitoxin component of YhaV-PrlF toxin-antitoxin module